MEKDDIIRQWAAALDSGSFLTPKHDPSGLDIAWDSFRTVLTPKASSSLDSYIRSGNYDIRQYKDSNYPSGSSFFEIVPWEAAPFSVAGSGVQSGSITPSGSYNRLVVANPISKRCHVYAEDSARISGSLASGRLTLINEL